MRKIALVLAIAVVGEGLLALHLVRQLHAERENAQTLQARVAELERTSTQRTPGATFVAVPTQPTASPFSGVGQRAATQPATAAVATAVAPATAFFSANVPPQDQQQMREQIAASIERERTLLQDPEYREAMLTQQKMLLARSNPEVAKDLNLTPDQVDRLFGTLAEQSLHSMQNMPYWVEPSDPAKVQEFQRQAMERQRANEAELKSVLGEAKYREWQEYQGLAGVRYEATRLRNSFADAGVPLDPSLSQPLMKVLQQQQKLEQQRLQQQFANQQGNVVVARAGFISAPAPNGQDVVQLMTNSVDSLAKTQQRQREALARVLSPEQIKVVEDQQNAELQMQRAQERLMRAQQAAGLEFGSAPGAAMQETVIMRDDAAIPSSSD